MNTDELVEGSVLLELKAVREFDEVHSAQCLNYMRATGLPVCLLMNYASPF
jgi:GxxExxY protein